MIRLEQGIQFESPLEVERLLELVDFYLGVCEDDWHESPEENEYFEWVLKFRWELTDEDYLGNYGLLSERGMPIRL